MDCIAPRHTHNRLVGLRIHCARSAIRWWFVHTVSGFEAPPVFPSSGPVARRPLPSTGSRRLRFPGFHGTMRRSDSLRTFTTGFLVVRPSLPLVGPTVESQGVPSSWGTLLCLCRVLGPRRDQSHQAEGWADAAPGMAKPKATRG